MKIRIRAVPLECFRAQDVKRKNGRKKKLRSYPLRDSIKSACYRAGNALEAIRIYLKEAERQIKNKKVENARVYFGLVLDRIPTLYAVRSFFPKVSHEEVFKLNEKALELGGYARKPSQKKAQALYDEIYRDYVALGNKMEQKCDSYPGDGD